MAAGKSCQGSSAGRRLRWSLHLRLEGIKLSNCLIIVTRTGSLLLAMDRTLKSKHGWHTAMHFVVTDVKNRNEVCVMEVASLGSRVTIRTKGIVRLIGGDEIRLVMRHTALMSTAASLYHRHRFPAEIISHSLWLYFRFPMSFF
jgi:hypothetical protein